MMKVKCVVCNETFESDSKVNNVCDPCMDDWRKNSPWYQKHVVKNRGRAHNGK